jgi:hypothetical protein
MDLFWIVLIGLGVFAKLYFGLQRYCERNPSLPNKLEGKRDGSFWGVLITVMVVLFLWFIFG